jgi:hypothetical protein
MNLQPQCKSTGISWIAGAVLLVVGSALPLNNAIAEVCDKFDPSWNPGDLPSIYLSGSWRILISPMSLVFLSMTALIAYCVFRGRAGTVAAVITAAFWASMAYLLIPSDDVTDHVTASGIKEGCISGETTLVHPAAICALIVCALLLLLVFRRPVARTVHQL